MNEYHLLFMYFVELFPPAPPPYCFPRHSSALPFLKLIQKTSKSLSSVWFSLLFTCALLQWYLWIVISNFRQSLFCICMCCAASVVLFCCMESGRRQSMILRKTEIKSKVILQKMQTTNRDAKLRKTIKATTKKRVGVNKL